MGASEQIRHLKLVIGAVDVTVPRESWAAPNLSDGVPKGAIVEILGPKKFEWFIAFVKQHPEIKTFWIEKEQQVLPTALQQRGLSLKQVTFGVLGVDPFVSIRKIIQSQVYQIVIAPNSFKELKMMRAFQLLTEKSNNTLFLVGQKTASTAWPIALQLEISGTKKEFKIEILKQKYGRTECE